MDVAEHHERFEVIAAFADGERVDTHALRAALADEAGRDYLIDLVAMREIVAGTTGTTGTTGATGADVGVVSHWRRGMTGLAAALAIAVGLAGYAIGQQRSRVVSVAVLLPLEADVIVAMEAPPEPTQVIRLGRGVPGDGGR
jgi:hypothetical protein